MQKMPVLEGCAETNSEVICWQQLHKIHLNLIYTYMLLLSTILNIYKYLCEGVAKLCPNYHIFGKPGHFW